MHLAPVSNDSPRQRRLLKPQARCPLYFWLWARYPERAAWLEELEQ